MQDICNLVEAVELYGSILGVDMKDRQIVEEYGLEGGGRYAANI